MRKFIKKIAVLITVIICAILLSTSSSNQISYDVKVQSGVKDTKPKVAINTNVIQQTVEPVQNEVQNTVQESVLVNNTENDNTEPEKFSSVEDLQKVNSGEEPQVYVNDNNSCKAIDGSYTNISVNSSEDAIKSVDSVSTIMGIDQPSNELAAETVNTSEELTAYKLQQQYNSVPVYGRQVIVSTDKAGKTTSIGGNYLADVNVNTTNTISEQQAIDSLKGKYGQDFTIESKGLTIYSLDNTNPTLCWQLLVQGVSDTEATVKYVFVDGNSGNVVAEKSLLIESTSVPTQTTDLQGNNRNINVTNLSNSEKTRPWDKTYELKDKARNIEIYNGADWRYWFYQPSSIIGSDNNVWVDKTAISAMANLEDTYDYYYKKLGRLSYDNKGAKIMASVHFKYPFTKGGFDNAFWQSGVSQFFFGDGQTYFTPLTGAKDVVAHEFTHAVIENTTGLIYEGEPGALNEAYADIMGNIIEGDNDPQWLLGEDVMKNGAIAIRSMSDPELLEQPSKVGGEYYHNPTDTSIDNGGVHINSGIVNHAAYLMWKNGISDKLLLSKLFYNSLFLMNSASTFEDCRIAVEIAAKNLKMSDKQIKIIDNAFDQVGVSVKQLNSVN